MDDWTPEDANSKRLIDVYADDMIVKYLLRPMALHTLEYIHHVPTTVILNSNKLLE